ncbi:MAG: TIGR02206 family membrane protein [Anaerolineales bacterium]|nr:TIGR02206 family membrane protein [Anaerolineales bacterium]
MEKYFSLIYEGPEFQLFGTAHLTALAIITLFCFSFLYFRKVWGEKEKKIIRWVFAVAIIVNETALHIWSIYWGIWNIQTMLPLHMCSVIIWLSAYMLVTKNYTIYELTYFLGLGGAMQAVLTPADAAAYNFPHFRIMQTFIAHGLLISIAIYMTVVEGFRPTLQSFKRIFIWTNIYMIPIFFLNQAIGSNYLFIAGKPDFPTLLDMLAPWPWYIIELEAIGFAIFFILYLPFLVKDWRAKSMVTA